MRLRFVAIINKRFGWLQPLSGVFLSHNVYATASEMHVMENPLTQCVYPKIDVFFCNLSIMKERLSVKLDNTYG